MKRKEKNATVISRDDWHLYITRQHAATISGEFRKRTRRWSFSPLHDDKQWNF